MKSTHIITVTAMAIALIAGCDNNDNTMDLMSVSPRDGESNVALNKNVTLSFDNPIARSVVQRNFHMMTTQKMAVIRDSMMTYMGMMGMMTHNDSLDIYDGMMRMMDNTAMHGMFTWNADSTQCVFDPDSLMIASTPYSMHMGQEMMSMVGMMSGDNMMSSGNHDMMGDAGGMMHGDMMTSFTTGNTMGK